MDFWWILKTNKYYYAYTIECWNFTMNVQQIRFQLLDNVETRIQTQQLTHHNVKPQRANQ